MPKPAVDPVEAFLAKEIANQKSKKHDDEVASVQSGSIVNEARTLDDVKSESEKSASLNDD